jgi:hypothetical protein
MVTMQGRGSGVGVVVGLGVGDGVGGAGGDGPPDKRGSAITVRVTVRIVQITTKIRLTAVRISAADRRTSWSNFLNHPIRPLSLPAGS